MKGAVYVNGTITAADETVVPVYDHGFVYGEDVYETLRTYNRVPFLYDRHMRRFRASAAALHLDVPFDDTLRGWIDDTMLTPRSAAGRLEGLTRGFLFEVGRDLRVPVEEATLRPADLDTAQEAFNTGSTRELTPVVRIDDQMVGTGRPGPVTQQLLEGFRTKANTLSEQPAPAR